MRKLSVIFCLVLIAALAAGLMVSCSSTSVEGPLALKMASAATGNYQEGEQAFCNAFNARCGPDYTIQYYGAGQMLAFPELLDGVRTGAADMAALTPNFN